MVNGEGDFEGGVKEWRMSVIGWGESAIIGRWEE